MSGLFKVVLYKWEWLVLFCLLAMTLAPGFVSADRVVDDFSTVQAPLLGLDPGTTVNALDASIIGSERDINVQGLLTGSVQVAAGLLDAQISLLANQSFLVVWDGLDADADTTDVAGLGGVDLTESGAVDGMEITVARATGPCDIDLSIFTDDSNSSRSTSSLVADSTGPLFLPFALFTPETGTGADMTNVGAISLELTTTTDALLQRFSVAAIKTSRSLTATLTAELLDDNDFDALASPGDTVRYTATITNPEDRKAEASRGVTFTASPGSNTTLVLGPTTTSQGRVTTGNTTGDTAVAVDIGTLTDGASATITFDALISQPISPSVTQVSCQGSVTSETIASGFSTDDPGAGGSTDATVTPIVKTVIGGTVLNDMNGNGTNDAGENGLSGVTLDLYHDADGSGTISAPDDRLAIVTTNAGGVFTAGVANHTNFLVEVTDTGGILTGLSLISGTTPSVLTIAPNGISTDLLFGYAASSTIGDTIWDDANGDGILNMGENGVPGVTVNLYGDLDSNGMINGGDRLEATVTTGSGGLYDFTALDPGPYIVDVTDTGAVLAGYAPTTTEPLALNLSDGEDNNDADFGFQSTASIGGIVWMDTNGDDIHTAEELGVDNVTLDLYRDLNGNRMVDVGDPLLETQTTAAGGTFDFTHRPPGNYLVTVTDTNGKLTGYNPATAVFLAIALSAGEDKKDADFGFHTTASIGGQIWKDSNGNGIRDTGEVGFNGVTVALYRDINADGTLDEGDILEATLSTSDGGIYSFANLVPGDYLIIITDTANVLANYSFETSSLRAIHVNPGESLTNEDVAATDKEGSISCFVMTLAP